jgi:hypothetical protein
MAVNVLEQSPINLDFLRKIIPDDGNLMITQIKNGNASNIPCSDFDAMGKLLRHSDLGGYDAYHACASFKDSTTRKAWNAKSLKALFLDLDCSEDKAESKQGYATKLDALKALKAFYRSVGLPSPIIVDSGGGIHAYWPFKVAVPAADWKNVARILKALCKTLGLLTDPVVTADAARILRPVGSYNRKYDHPRRVVLLRDAECEDFGRIKAIIDNAANRLGTVSVRMNGPAKDVERPVSLAEQVNPNSYSLSEVEEALRRINPECTYSEWMPVGMTIADAFGENGRDLFLKWSRGDLWGAN